MGLLLVAVLGWDSSRELLLLQKSLQHSWHSQKASQPSSRGTQPQPAWSPGHCQSHLYLHLTGSSLIPAQPTACCVLKHRKGSHSPPGASQGGVMLEISVGYSFQVAVGRICIPGTPRGRDRSPWAPLRGTEELEHHGAGHPGIA